jgi:hypothetical protein
LVTFFCKYLHGPPPNIPLRFSTTSLGCHCTDSEKHLALLANSIQELGVSEGRYILGNLEFAPSPDGEGVNNTLWNPLAGKVGEGLNELCIL